MKQAVTIFTPTYNRAYILPRVYESLCNQTNKGFIWLIVDDGSIDNTRYIVNRWINEEIITIRYIYQENEGKHIAHNMGVDACETELFVCVDSDDYLLPNAVDEVINTWNDVRKEELAGIVSMRITENGAPIGKVYLPKNIQESTLGDLYDRYKFKGDTMLTFRSSILREYKFPKIDGEKFIGEDYVYAQIDKNYKLYVLNKGLYVCEYLEDGYTKNSKRLIQNNPKGYALLKEKKMLAATGIKGICKHTILYGVGNLLCNNRGFIKNSPYPIKSFLLLPISYVVYLFNYKVRKRYWYKES